MNAALDGLPLSKIPTPTNLAMLFDADAPVRSFAGGAGDVAVHRHSGRPSVAFSDGHVQDSNEYARASLSWTPEAEAERPKR